MKFYNIILFASLILYILSDECEGKESASSKKDCKDLKTDGYKCCFIKVKDKDGESSGCTTVSKENYDNIKDYIKKWEEEGKSEDLKIKKLDCKSIYLELSVLSFILLLL